MENTQTLPCDLYQLAKKITQTSNDNEKEKLSTKLETLVENLFKNDKFHEIENALSIAAEKDEMDVMTLIMDDAEVEVSHVAFKKKRKSLVSSMLLLSCMVISGQETVTLPSVKKMQDIIQKHLLKAGQISKAEQFRLGAIRIDNDTLDDLNMVDWWNIHRNIIADLDNIDASEPFNTATKVELDDSISMFHLVPVIIGTEKDNLLEGLFSSEYTGDVWHEISKELSEGGLAFDITAPNFISRGISQSQYILQTSQLKLMLEEYKQYANIELAYVKTEEEGTYIVFALDNEDNTLADFYIFETDGNETEFVTMLVNEAQEFPSETIWHFDKSILLGDIEDWYGEKTIYLDDLMKHAHDINLKQYKSFMHAGSGQYLH